MKNRIKFLSLVLLLAVLLTACGGAAAPKAMTENPDDVMMEGSDEVLLASFYGIFTIVHLIKKTL